jgi:sensor histidine kinase YesM
VILDTLDHVTQGELQRYENNYKTLNLITTVLGRNVYDRVAHLETTHDVWLKLCNTYEGSSEIKPSHRDTYNRQYQIFSQKPGESLDDCFARFESIAVTYVLVVLLLILTMNVLNNFSMHLMILYGA